MPTSTVENYLKCIYLEQRRTGGQPVPTGRIAAALQVAPGTATAMVKALAESGLALHEPYAGAKLTPAGLQLATLVLRRHRLIELFLVRVMGMNWSEVHTEAEILEHHISERLLERIDRMLGFPSADPHGDPIPGPGGEIEEPELPNLLQCALDAPLRLVRVTDQRREFLRLLEDHALLPGRRLHVRSRDELAETCEVHPEDGEPLRLGFRAAETLLVEPGERSRTDA